MTMVQKVVEVSPADSSEYISIATYLPIEKWKHVIPFLRLSGQVVRQLRGIEGVVRYGLRTDLPHKRFWTYSVWKDPQAIRLFVAEEPHATAIKRFAQWAGAGAAFVEWKDMEGRVDWEEAGRRLKTPTYFYRR